MDTEEDVLHPQEVWANETIIPCDNEQVSDHTEEDVLEQQEVLANTTIIPDPVCFYIEKATQTITQVFLIKL